MFFSGNHRGVSICSIGGEGLVKRKSGSEEEEAKEGGEPWRTDSSLECRSSLRCLAGLLLCIRSEKSCRPSFLELLSGSSVRCGVSSKCTRLRFGLPFTEEMPLLLLSTVGSGTLPVVEMYVTHFPKLSSEKCPSAVASSFTASVEICSSVDDDGDGDGDAEANCCRCFNCGTAAAAALPSLL